MENNVHVLSNKKRFTIVAMRNMGFRQTEKMDKILKCIICFLRSSRQYTIIHPEWFSLKEEGLGQIIPQFIFNF